jgi:hypothetical protein
VRLSPDFRNPNRGGPSSYTAAELAPLLGVEKRVLVARLLEPDVPQPTMSARRGCGRVHRYDAETVRIWWRSRCA